MFYQTRVMVALADFPHGRDLLRAGDSFVATQIDADYYQKRGKARFAPELETNTAPPPAAPAPAPAPSPAVAPVADAADGVAGDQGSGDADGALADGTGTEGGDAGVLSTSDAPALVDAVAESATVAEEAAAPAPAPTARRGRGARTTTTGK